MLKSARDRLIPCSRDDSDGNFFFPYSKWHRLNQEVEKTTQKNKLDKKYLFLLL